VCRSVLKGRPLGGTCIPVKKSFLEIHICREVVFCSEKCVIILIGNIFVNIMLMILGVVTPKIKMTSMTF